MAKNSEGKMMPDARDSTKPSISLLETEEDSISTMETEDASPPLKAETTWMSMP